MTFTEEKMFPLLSLPIECQQIVTDIIVKDNPPAEALNFGVSSRHSYSLFKRAQGRKELANASFFFSKDKCEFSAGTDVSKVKAFTSSDDISDLLKQFYITNCFEIKWDCHMNLSLFPKIWEKLGDSSKFVQNLRLVLHRFDDPSTQCLVHFLKKLHQCRSLEIRVSMWDPQYVLPVEDMVSALRYHDRITIMRGNACDDTFLEMLADKTSEDNPLKDLCIFSNRGFTVDGVAKLLEKGSFSSTTKISLSSQLSSKDEFLKYFNTIGEVSELPQRNAVLIRIHGFEVIFYFPLEAPSHNPPPGPAAAAIDLRNFWRNVFPRRQ